MVGKRLIRQVDDVVDAFARQPELRLAGPTGSRGFNHRSRVEPWSGDSIDGNADPALLNPYGVIPVNPDKSDAINSELAEKFAEWITSDEVQEQIGQFGVDKYGQPLFYPNAQ